MKKLIKTLSLISICFTLLAASGCAKAKDTATSADSKKTDAKPVTLTIPAAASLTDALNEIKGLYSKEKSNVTLTYTFGASGTLEQQIEQGADADLFISAATKQMDQLKAKSLVAEDTLVNLLGNKLVLVLPKSSSLTITDFNTLTDDKVKKLALGEPKSVPAGQYAEDVFTKLGTLDKMKAKAVYGKDVKEVLTWTESGNADAGIVYESDAKTSSKVKIAAYAPEGSYKAIVYPAAVLKNSKNSEDAKAFLKFLSSDKAKTVFTKYGFSFIAK